MSQIKRKYQTTIDRKISSPVGRLMRIGRNKSYVTYDDILQVIPQPEQHMQYLELIFATLMAANIPFIDDRD